MTIMLGTASSWIAVLAVCWLMVWMGSAKRALEVRRHARCAACGRQLGRGPCPCSGEGANRTKGESHD